MTGKSYSIREMKNIVDYLTANKLYSEIRGRKMWMDYANSKHTTRTWQSLKETFLKRILTDLHNPYYELKMEQVESFRVGYDLVERNKNKLEIHSVSDDSNSNGPNQKVTPQTNNGNGIKEENTAGENIKPSKIPSRSRSSADTVIVETCYETAEDIQKDLESPTGEKDNGGTKSLRDCITYSEPLTPMLQEVLDDFQSEPENDPEVSEIEMIHSELTENSENVQQVVSNTNNETDKSKHVDNADPEKSTDSAFVSDKEVKEKQPNEPEPAKKIQDSATVDKSSEIVCLDDSPTEDNDELKNVEEETFHPIKNDTDKLEKITVASNTENTEIVEVSDSSQNAGLIPHSGAIPNSNSTTDTSLPNNPEALKKRISDEKQDDKMTPPQKKIDSKGIRKRSNSENIVKVIENKKTKLEQNKKKSTSENEGNRVDDTTTKVKPSKAEQKGDSTKKDSISSSKDEANNSKIAPSLANILEKPLTSLADDVNQILLSDTEQGGKVNESSEIINPCLQNVSLFEEQINKKKYNMSEESSDMEQKKKNEASKGKKEKYKQKEKEIVLLKSHSESDTEEIPTPPKKKHRTGVSMSKKDRDRALANVFGFASGTSQSKRKRQLSHRRRTISHNNISHNNGGSNSSEWTSESDSDMYVLPPRGRKNRQTKKYLKPQSGRIFSLEEEGGLFVMYGKKIYPLVKDGRLVKNYLHYMPESDSEEEKNFWKIKYVKEKKKADELKKLLEQAKEPHAGQSTSSDLQPNPLRDSISYQNPPQATSSNAEICIPVPDERKEVAKATAPESIKIKFTTKNDQEIHLEGNWPQINNVLEHVVHIFHKEPQPVSEYKPKAIVEPPSSSGISTPIVITAVQEPGVDPEVHEKVNKIESEIFKEIEERDNEEQNQPSSNGQDSNITKRRAGRPRKSSQSSAPQSPAKRQKISDQQDSEVNSTNSKGNDNENNEGNKRQSRASSRTILNESPSSNDAKSIQTRRSKLKLDTSLSGKANEDEEVRYMFPPRNRRQNTKSATDKNTRDKPQKSTAKPPTIYSSPETVCPNSMDSTLGYQDSDPTPIRIDLRKKKLMNQSVLKSKSKSHLRRSSRKKLQSYLYSDDTVNSRVEAPINKIERDNSTLNTSVYRSDSYQLLMPQAKASLGQLEQIDETSSIENEVDFIQHLDSTAKNEVFSVQMTSNYNEGISGLVSSDVGSSSNVSLLISPELSIVERMSVSKELLEHGSTINEIQSKETIVPMSCSQFFISNIDVSVPLMQQECGLQSCNVSEEINHKEPKSVVTESLLSKIGTFNIEDQPNVTDTLDAKLRDLLLESAKKIAIENIQNKENSYMDVDMEVENQVKNKKRSSTPRKRKNSHKSKKVLKVHTVVEEEHVESYSKGGRKSCPPVIQPSVREDNLIIDEINISALAIDENKKPKGRKKKDVIKVKILRPKSKKSKNNSTKSVKASISSICTDSGINDTEYGCFHPINENVDLIHNHSETCLHTNDCVGNSVEFVENSKSIVTLGDSTHADDNIWDSQYEFNDAQDISPDIFCNNAQDVRSFYNTKLDDVDDCETVYHSPIGTEISSLITDDLSDDLPQPPPIKPNKWYLLSEDETVNTNNASDPSANLASYGANLKQIFPLTCAVPDLSTITERSDDSRKPTLEGITGDGFNSHSILDSNF